MGVDDRDWMRVRSIFGWIRPEYIHAGTERRATRVRAPSPAGSEPTATPISRPVTRVRTRHWSRLPVLLLAILMFAGGIGSVRASALVRRQVLEPRAKDPCHRSCASACLGAGRKAWPRENLVGARSLTAALTLAGLLAKAFALILFASVLLQVPFERAHAAYGYPRPSTYSVEPGTKCGHVYVQASQPYTALTPPRVDSSVSAPAPASPESRSSTSSTDKQASRRARSSTPFSAFTV
jgi:hypothetical protein